jgi:methylated-DNA-[protein]-cysteine S-methyltransferase
VLSLFNPLFFIVSVKPYMESVARSVLFPGPLGTVSITISEQGYLRKIGLSSPKYRSNKNDGDKSQYMSDCRQLPQDSPTLENIVNQLTRYFLDPQWRFKLPLAPGGTPFQRRVWQALRMVPSGKTITYGMLAAQLGTGARAVGNACRKNPIPIIIPCHRVVAARDWGGFMGERMGRPLAIKQWLLRHESFASGDQWEKSTLSL